MAHRGLPAALIAAVFTFLGAASAADAPVLGPDSAQPVPRFVSLAAANANGRHGPGLDHRIDWIYQRPGLPLQVIAESGPWRKVRDPDGGEVWMHARNLAAKRTIMARPAEGDELALRRSPRPIGRAVAYLAPGVTADLTGCEGDWRRVTINGRVGWAHKDALWGADDC